MAAPDPADRCADPAGRDPPSRAEGGAGLATLLVQLAVQVQALENEFHRRGDRSRVSGRADLGDGALHPGYLESLLYVLLAREGGGNVHRRAALERGEERVELHEREGPVEDVQNGALDQPVDDALLGDLADRLGLDL